MKNKGFTLVELSIVLVIIGLLISGILVAQSMVETAKIVKFVRQIDQYDAGVALFQSQYRGLPGDSSIMGCTNTFNNTCDNGQLEDTGGVSTLGRSNSYTLEVLNFWRNLQFSGFDAQGTQFATSFISAFKVEGASRNSPSVPLGKRTGIIPYYNVGQPMFDTASSGGAFYLVADFPSSADYFLYRWGQNLDNASGYWTSIPASSALAIDTKIDNGLPDDPVSGVAFTGTPPWQLHNVYNATGTDYQAPSSEGTPCTNNFKYNVSDSSSTCALLIRMGSRTAM